MKLRDYLNSKPSEGCFDLHPTKYRGWDLHLYEDAQIISIKEDPKNLNRKIIEIDNKE